MVTKISNAFLLNIRVLQMYIRSPPPCLSHVICHIPWAFHIFRYDLPQVLSLINVIEGGINKNASVITKAKTVADDGGECAFYSNRQFLSPHFPVPFSLLLHYLQPRVH